jgi:hypothetical protein
MNQSIDPDHPCYAALENADNGDPWSEEQASKCLSEGWRVINNYILAPGESVPEEKDE